MSFDNILHLYKNSYYKFPQPLKLFLGELYGKIPLHIRFGQIYTNHLNLLKKFEDNNQQYQLDYIYNKTLETLLFAEQHIPFYRNKFRKHCISSSDFKEISDISRFPTLEKSHIQNNLDELYTNFHETPTAYFTGGSTSAPTKYYLPLTTSRGKEKAYNLFALSSIGYKYRDKTVLFKGREVADVKKHTYSQREPIDNYLVVATNHLNSIHFKKIHQDIIDYSPRFFFGYPSAILDYIHTAHQYNIQPVQIDGVILTSEMVYQEEINLIKNNLTDNILIKYGHTERVCFATNTNLKYKMFNSYGLHRIVENELVGVSFDNFVMPFINYRTNDYVSGNINFFPGTDVAISLSDIEGRLQEYLVAADGRLISICVMGAGHYSSLNGVDAIQYQQSEPGKVQLLVESRRDIDCNAISAQLLNFTNNAIDFNVVKVEKLEKTSRGKRIMCKQSLDVDSYRKH